jgi:hypothetical protein
MKQYAGAPQAYISFDTNPGNPRWVINRANSVDNNVVGEFCTCESRQTCRTDLTEKREVPMYTVRVAAIFTFFLNLAFGQIYFITGSPTPKHNQSFGSSLFQVGEEGSVRLVQKLVDETDGTDWISISYDVRKAVLATRGSREKIVVVDLDTATISKICPTPLVYNMSVIRQHIGDIPGHGPHYLQYLVGDNNNTLFRGMSLSSNTSCEESFSIRPYEDGRFITIHGKTGIADIGGFDWQYVRITQDERLNFFLAKQIPMEYRIPGDLIKGIHPTAMMVNNRVVFAVLASDVDRATREVRRLQLISCLKISGRCQPVPVPKDSPLWARGFEHYIAMAEAHSRKSGPDVEKSAGASEWRKFDGPMGPSIESRMKDFEYLFPGRLHLFNAESGQLYTITTNQGDSEILLVENGSVYYRASDRLYKAQITPGGITGTRLLVQTDAMRDAHWAFTKR